MCNDYLVHIRCKHITHSCILCSLLPCALQVSRLEGLILGNGQLAMSLYKLIALVSVSKINHLRATAYLLFSVDNCLAKHCNALILLGPYHLYLVVAFVTLYVVQNHAWNLVIQESVYHDHIEYTWKSCTPHFI